MLILQIQQADNIHLVELAREDRVISCFVEAGFSSRISADTIPEALSLLSLHHCILAVKAEIHQFCTERQPCQKSFSRTTIKNY